MINTTIIWNEGSICKELPYDESGFYKEIGSLLLDIEIPNTMHIKNDFGDAEFRIGKRGSFMKNGVAVPSMYVTETYNNICGLDSSSYSDAYLTCINPESNNYKFYHLKPGPSGIGATYGRIGSTRGEMFGTKDLTEPYPNHLYWIRYYEKLSKGYIDQSDVYLAKEKPKKAKVKKNIEKSEKSSVNEASAHLYKQLIAYARHVVQTNLINASVTEIQVKKSRYYLNQMGKRKTVKGFNNQLMKLLAVCPRKARYISELLAGSQSDFLRIMEREESLIAAMEALVGHDEYTTQSSEDSFEYMGIEVYYATDTQKKQVLSHLDDRLKAKVKTIYRVIPKIQNERFDAYLKKENIRKVIQLWHGSKNENWFSIIQNGLLLNPNAEITGKMFGCGIYFAPSSTKSWNYTSYNGTYWANGKSDIGFMGLYAVAYGKPLDVYSPADYTQSILKEKKANSVHAHAGTYLRNDEIILYDESAMTLNYIVEFA